MESNVSMMEGIEWGSSFHGVVSFNEEADFMAHWFPNCALDNNNNNNLESLSSSCYSGLTVGGECGSFFSNNHEDDDDDYKNNNNNSNMCSLAQEMISNTSYSDNCNNNDNNTAKSHVRLSDCLSAAYPFYYENGFLGATDDNNNDCSFPVELFPSVAKNFIQLFPGNPMERNDSLSCLDQHSHEQHYSNNQKHQENEMFVSLKKDKSTENLGCGRKRSRISENNKGKKNTRTKKNNNDERNNNNNDNNNNKCDNNEENNSSSSEGESHEMSGGVASSSLSSKGTTIVNTNGKTRASRGAATDPQSLYARKRRERINERLRILQSLVPNGTKVDISTMLEEAVHYVKFLQQQIKLLSSDDLWMYAPLAYNGMDIGLDSKLTALL